MVAKILDGRAVALTRQKQLTEIIHAQQNKGLRAPGLAVIQVGNDPASHIYVHHKRQACQSVGITSFAYDLPEHTTEAELLDLIDTLNADDRVDGLLVQLPLPDTIQVNRVLDRVHPDKDVDGFHPYNMGCLAQQRPTLRPCTPYGIINLLASFHIDIEGVNAVIVGASNIVGRPLAFELLLADTTVTVCHIKTQKLEKHVSNASLLVSCVGKTGVISSDWIKPGAIVIDVGINRLNNGRIVGDIDFESAKQRASWITPVPGGVGPMTVVTLLENTFLAYTKKIDRPPTIKPK